MHSNSRIHTVLPALAALLLPFAAGTLHAGIVTLNDRPFTLPDGFEIIQIAGPPLVNRPIAADFDESGRLYVADSSGSNDKVTQQLEEKPHRIVRLEDTNGDGIFDRSVVFADRMMFPEGAMWSEGSLFVSAPPSIWKLTDTDDDGVADQRVEWMQGKTLTGCANDLHGPYRGPDGWIYWCKGAFAEQSHPRPGLPPFVTRAAHIFRSRPDGTGIEPVMTGGMDNPVDVAFTPEGERIFTTTFFQHPGGGQRDGLIHALYGGVYGKIHDVIEGHPRTGEVLPVLTHMGPAAPCGLTRYESGAFGPDYLNNLFACQFNLHKVSRHVLLPKGGSYQSQDSDFISSTHPDFHPTDVIEDADGSLIIIDTGGWYKLCCPTSQLWKPDVLGAIYRVRKSGANRPFDPRGIYLDWSHPSASSLADRLADPRPAVRQRAMNALASHGPDGLPALKSLLNPRHPATLRSTAVWTLCRINDPEARVAVRTALDDPESSVRHAAAHAAALWRDPHAVPQLTKFLASNAPALRRVAAEALGRIRAPAAIPSLLRAAGSDTSTDWAVTHSLTFALIEIADAAATLPGLNANSAATRRAALFALDQMQPQASTPDMVIPLLNDPDPGLRSSALWILQRRSEWGAPAAKFLRDSLAQPDAPLEPVQSLLTSLSRNPEIQKLVAELAQNSNSPVPQRLLALDAMARAGLRSTPSSWVQALQACLDSKSPELVPAAIAAARVSTPEKQDAPMLANTLLRVAADDAQPDPIRLQAAAATPNGIPHLDQACFSLALRHLDSSSPVALRADACSTLARAKLDENQILLLADALGHAGPLELSRLLPAFEQHTNHAVGLRMIEALSQSKSLPALHPDLLRTRLLKFPASVQSEGAALLARMNTDSGQQQARLESLLASVGSGDVRNGQTVFNSTKAACASCHAIGYLGGNLGPDLTRIGQIRNERDLLEAIVYPSASFVRSFEPMIVVTRSGDVHSGVLHRENPGEVVLGTGPNLEVRIDRADVAEMRPGTVSVMPSGLDQQLSKQELADLLAFLKATKW